MFSIKSAFLSCETYLTNTKKSYDGSLTTKQGAEILNFSGIRLCLSLPLQCSPSTCLTSISFLSMN